MSFLGERIVIERPLLLWTHLMSEKIAASVILRGLHRVGAIDSEIDPLQAGGEGGLAQPSVPH